MERVVLPKQKQPQHPCYAHNSMSYTIRWFYIHEKSHFLGTYDIRHILLSIFVFSRFYICRIFYIVDSFRWSSNWCILVPPDAYFIRQSRYAIIQNSIHSLKCKIKFYFVIFLLRFTYFLTPRPLPPPFVRVWHQWNNGKIEKTRYKKQQ